MSYERSPPTYSPQYNSAPSSSTLAGIMMLPSPSAIMVTTPSPSVSVCEIPSTEAAVWASLLLLPLPAWCWGSLSRFLILLKIASSKVGDVRHPILEICVVGNKQFTYRKQIQYKPLIK